MQFKKMIFVFLGLFLLCLDQNSSAQKIMQLDSSLASNSTMFPVKIKTAITAGHIFKYQFGPYKVISTKEGWGSSTTRSKLFSRVERTKGKNKASFKLQCADTDTIEVSMLVNMDAVAFYESYFSIGKIDILSDDDEGPDTRIVNYNVSAVFFSGLDTSEWTLMLVSRFNKDSSINAKKYGFLINGTDQIEIKEVKAWEGSKAHKIYLTKGFEFCQDGRAIAAVQCPINTLQKKFAWFKNDIKGEMKNILAAAMVVFMGYNEAAQ